MIKQLIPQKFCLACLGCCRFLEPDSCWSPRLLKGEAKNLAQKKLLDKKQLAGLRVPLRLSRDADNDWACLFLEPRSNKCQAYPYRPFDCQLYPFLLQREENRILLAVDPNCPFAKRQADSLELKKYAAYLIKLLNSPYYQKVLKENRQIIQRYDQAIGLGELRIRP